MCLISFTITDLSVLFTCDLVLFKTEVRRPIMSESLCSFVLLLSDYFLSECIQMRKSKKASVSVKRRSRQNKRSSRLKRSRRAKRTRRVRRTTDKRRVQRTRRLALRRRPLKGGSCCGGRPHSERIYVAPAPSPVHDLTKKMINAAKKGDVAEITALVNHHAPVNGLDEKGLSAMYWATFWGYVDVMEELHRLARGRERHDMLYKEYDGMNLLLVGAEQPESVKWLHNKGLKDLSGVNDFCRQYGLMEYGKDGLHVHG